MHKKAFIHLRKKVHQWHCRVLLVILFSAVDIRGDEGRNSNYVKYNHLTAHKKHCNS